MQSKKLFVVFLICGVIFLAGYLLAVGEIPHLINYQGKLTDDAGNPLTDNYDLTFKIYNDPTGGSLLWSETHTGVAVNNGIFSVILGTFNPINLSFDSHYWLEVMVGAETIAPRRQLTSVGYSFRAQKADTAEHVINAPSDTAKYAWNADSLDGKNASDFAPAIHTHSHSELTGIGPSDHHVRYSDSEARAAADDITTWGHPNRVTNLNADRVDNYHAGNSSGQVAVSNGSLCNNLNADKLDGKHANAFVDLSSTQTVGGNKTFTKDIISQDDVWAGVNKAVLGYGNTYGNGYCEIFTPNGNRLDLVGYLSGTNGLNGGVWIYRNGSARGYYYVDTDNSGVLALKNSSGATTIYLEGSTGTIYKNTVSFRTSHPLYANKDITYCALEGPEAAAYTRGTADLTNGKAYVKFPDHFSLIINRTTMTVQLTPLSSVSHGLAVTHKDSTGFTVEELNNGTGNYAFDYLVQAVRKGYEDYKVIRDKLTPKDGASEVGKKR